MKRSLKNPLITPADILPSRPDFEVVCAFNAGITKFKNETLMLIRVAERPKCESKNIVKSPHLIEVDGEWKMTIKTFDKEKDSNKYDFSDPRKFFLNSDREIAYLTSISHLRLARSKDGENFIAEDKPFIKPETKYEAFGTEDARITLIEGKYYINYTAVSSKGISTALAVTEDFITLKRIGIAFEPDNRDVCFFPEKINGMYLALTRPAPKQFGKAEIWLAESPDLLHWGNHKHLLGVSGKHWDSLKLGGGAQVLKTDKGWLEIYHGVDSGNRYCLGALLLDFDDPMKIIAKSTTPLLEPEADYEKVGFFNNVVFSSGALIENDILKVYYGGADRVMALAELSLNELWKHLSV